MTQALKRGLFGYRPGSVKSILADREQMFERATRDAEAARSRGEELATQLETAQGELEKVRAELEMVRTELEADQAERDAIEADRETMRSQRDLANTERDKLLAELVTARTDRDSARTELDEANARIRELERDDAEGATTTEGREGATPITTSEELDRVLLATESTIGRIVGEARRGAERELAEVERRRDEVRAEVEALVARRDRLAPLAASVRELLGEAQTRTEDVDSRIRAVLEPLAGTVEALRSRLAELMDEAERDDEVEIVASEEGAGEDEPSAVIHLADGPRTAPSPW